MFALVSGLNHEQLHKEKVILNTLSHSVLRLICLASTTMEPTACVCLSYWYYCTVVYE